MNNRYVFDLDNTLIMTDELNNHSYNYALSQFRLSPIKASTRITRDIVFDIYPDLPEFQKNQIVQLKQDYFIANIHCTHPNAILINLLQSKNSAHCILWTSADKNRVSGLLMYYRLEDRFISIIYSSKRKLREDIEEICNVFNCTSKQLFFYENDLYIVNELRLLGQKAADPHKHAALIDR